MKKHKIIEEVGWVLTDEARSDERLNAIDKNILAILQTIADYKVPAHNKNGYFPISLKHNHKLRGITLEDRLKEFDVPTAYCTITRSIDKLLRLDYIDYKRGFWNKTTSSGQLPYIKILKGTFPRYIESSESLMDSKTDTSTDIATTIYSKTDSENEGEFLSTSESVSNKDIATTIDVKLDIELEKKIKKTVAMYTESPAEGVRAALRQMRNGENFEAALAYVEETLRDNPYLFKGKEREYIHAEFERLKQTGEDALPF